MSKAGNGAMALAKAVGVDKGTTSRWLNGLSRPSRLARARLEEAGIALVLPARPVKRRQAPRSR